MEGNKPGRQPIVLTETGNLTLEEWLGFRRKGIGGSDAAAVMGLSPFATCRDLFYEKTGRKPPVEPKTEENWVAKKVGHLLEDLVAEIFAAKTGYKLIKTPKMFCHPEHMFMLANLDYLVELPDGSTAILECKTTNFFGKDRWNNGAVLVNYEIQGRHYMAVMDIDRVFYACLYGNNEDQFIIRELERDHACESELIFEETLFWNEYVLKEQMPPFTEESELAAACIEKYAGAADASLPGIALDKNCAGHLAEYLRLKEEKSAISKTERELNERMKAEALPIIELIGRNPKGHLTCGDNSYEISYAPTSRSTISKDDLERLKFQHPDIYREFVSASVSRSFTVKLLDKKTAAA